MALKVKDITKYLESIAPLAYQESYDNSGLIYGNLQQEVTSVLASVDVTEDVIDEAIELGCNMVLAHHPIVFSGLKKITGKTYIERTIIKAIKNDVAIYAAHTNLDSVPNGVNGKICEKMGLSDCKILHPSSDNLLKLVTFVPLTHAEGIRDSLFQAGAGTIGNYDNCSFNLEGKGTFRANQNTNPFVGRKGEVHTENEVRIETIFPKHLQSKIISTLLNAHPYEEVAFDLYPLANKNPQIGIGMIGNLEKEMSETGFLSLLKKTFHCEIIKHTKLLGKPINKVAVCGGSGSFLLSNAIAAKADVFVTGDFKYHQYFDADGKIIIADIGHFESEQFTKELFYELLTKNFPKFAVHLSKVETNPVFYF